MDYFFSIIGFLIAFLPIVLLFFAWRFAGRRTDTQAAWRKRAFTGALMGNGLAWLWFWAVFLILTRTMSSGAYERIGWVSESLSLVLIALSLTGAGVARLLAALAAAGVAMMWVSVGFW